MFERLFGGQKQRQNAAAAARVEPSMSGPMSGPKNAASLSSSASMEEWQEFFSLPGSGHITREAAMKFTAVFACVSMLSGTIGTLPVRVVRKGGAHGNKAMQDHPLHFLLSAEPNEEMSAVVFFEGLLASAFLEGNEYAEIQSTRNGQITGLVPLWDAQIEPFKTRAGRLAYRVSDESGTRGLDASQIIHFRTTATTHGLKALSPLKNFARSIGIGIRAEEFAEKFYDQGLNTPGYISFEGEPSSEFQADELRENWTGKRGLKGVHVPPILVNGGKFHSLMTDPETAQLFRSREFQVLDVARAYGVPPHLIGETDKSTSWGSGIQAQTTQFYMLALRRHIERIESELTNKLLTRAERLDGICVEFNLDALLRADVSARFEMHKIALGGTQHPAIKSQNEVRKEEGLPELSDPEADKLFRPKVTDKPAAPPSDPAQPQFSSVRGHLDSLPFTTCREDTR